MGKHNSIKRILPIFIPKALVDRTYYMSSEARSLDFVPQQKIVDLPMRARTASMLSNAGFPFRYRYMLKGMRSILMHTDGNTT